MTEPSTTIRKAAVLVLALDERTADALLDQMPEETARRVRAAVMELGDITPAEQEAVLAEFLRGPGPQRRAAVGNAAVELELSSASATDAQRPTPQQAAAASSDRFAFLRDIPPRVIGREMEGEHEQTIALVISRLEPDLAAQVLEQLSAERATNVLERMAWLEEPAEEVLAEIERHLRAALAAQAGSGRGESPSLAGVKALVGAMDGAARERVLAGLGQRNGRLARELGYRPPATTRPIPQPAERYDVTAFRYRLERRDPASASIEFADFIGLADEALRQILAAAEPETALLALTGADESLVRRVLDPLPPREAAVLRHRLSQSPVGRRGEIDQARRHVAAIACRLAAEGTIVLPPSRRFAAAA
jgi:flagellar motor switch protein FliG